MKLRLVRVISVFMGVGVECFVGVLRMDGGVLF